MNYYEKAKCIVDKLREKTGYDVRWDLQIVYALGQELPHFTIYVGDNRYEISDVTFMLCDIDETVTEVLETWKS